MTTFDRRSFLALGAAGAATGGLTAPRSLAPAVRPSLDEIARVFIDTGGPKVFRSALELHERGATWRDLLGGVFLAGVREVEPRPVGFKFHAIMMTASAYQIGEAVTPSEQLWPAMYNLYDFKRSQRQDQQQGDWSLTEAGAPAGVGFAEARARYTAAMDAWDEEKADRAAVELHASSSLDDAFELLWPYGARSFQNIGHNIIYTSQAYRTLQQIGWRHGEPVLRSLTHGLLDGKPGEVDKLFAPNRRLATKIRDGWTVGDRDPEASQRLLIALRDGDEEKAAKHVVDLLNGGLASTSVWDGLRLFTLEILMRRPGLLAVHPMTCMNAFRFAFDRTRHDITKRLLLLQATAWSVAYRKFFENRGGFDTDRSGIDSLRAATDATADAAFATDDRDRAASMAVALAANGEQQRVAKTARQILLRKVKEHHDYKYVAAVLEEIELADERWRPTLSGASMFYLRRSGEKDGPFFDQVHELLG